MAPSLLEITSAYQPQVGLEDVRMTTEVHADVNSEEQILNQYKRGPLIGKGQHGNVYVCYDLSQQGSLVAMKVVNRKNPKQDRMKELRRKKVPASGSHLPVTDNLSSTEHKIRKEIAIMKKCRHPHVVRLIEVIDDKLYKKVYMVMEYLGGGEVKWRDPSGRPVLRVEQCRRICRDVILGLEYLHHQGVIHRDIKPGNLLCTQDRRMVKIADFGVAHITAAHLAVDPHSRTPTSSDNLALLFDDSELCKTAGTPAFLAPEVVIEFGRDMSASGSEAGSIDENRPEPLQASESRARVQGSGSTVQVSAYSRPPITKAVDVWALGVTLYCLLFGELPFNPKQRNEFQLYKVICTEDWDVPEKMGLDQLPTGGRHQPVDPSRPSEGALIVSLLEKLLEKDASKRITLDEVKVRFSPYCFANLG
ncbi:kinase-like domain-containing protein [Amylostereum chailletii]|nr:kinase-like domain-containing protein [Amylostereum chailletii]